MLIVSQIILYKMDYFSLLCFIEFHLVASLWSYLGILFSMNYDYDSAMLRCDATHFRSLLTIPSKVLEN